MRRKLLLLMLLPAWTAAVLCPAEDARALPRGLLRVEQTTCFSFADSEFTTDGRTVEIPEGGGRVRTLTLGGALELGVTDRVSAALEWSPGWTVWSAYDFQTSPSDMLSVNGSFDLFAGARVQVLDLKTASGRRGLRLTVVPGAVIPLPSPDWEEQEARKLDGRRYKEFPNDNHTPGLGAQAYLDLVFHEHFFLDLKGEFTSYFRKDFAKADMTAYSYTVSGLTDYEKVDYGYALTVQAAPQFERMLGRGLKLSAAAPVTWRSTPELRFDGTEIPDSDTYLLTVSPNVSLLLAGLTAPLEVKIGYSWPLLGKGLDKPALRAVTLELASYVRLFR